LAWLNLLIYGTALVHALRLMARSAESLAVVGVARASGGNRNGVVNDHPVG